MTPRIVKTLPRNYDNNGNDIGLFEFASTTRNRLTMRLLRSRMCQCSRVAGLAHGSTKKGTSGRLNSILLSRRRDRTLLIQRCGMLRTEFSSESFGRRVACFEHLSILLFPAGFGSSEKFLPSKCHWCVCLFAVGDHHIP